MEELEKIPKLPADVINFVNPEVGDVFILFDISKLRQEEANIYKLREQDITELRRQDFLRKMREINK